MRDQNTVFSAVAAYQPPESGIGSQRLHPASLGSGVTGQYFEVVGISPLLGRLLQRADDEPGRLGRGGAFLVGLEESFWRGSRCDRKDRPDEQATLHDCRHHPGRLRRNEKFLQPATFSFRWRTRQRRTP